MAAALELVLALNHLAADRVGITMVAPEPDFNYRPPSTAAPFALGYVERYPLRRLADHLGARLVPDALARVSNERHEIVTTSGAVVPYLLGRDALVDETRRSEPHVTIDAPLDGCY